MCPSLCPTTPYRKSLIAYKLMKVLFLLVTLFQSHHCFVSSSTTSPASNPISSIPTDMNQQNPQVSFDVVHKKKVYIIGCGSFATAMARRIALNIQEKPYLQHIYERSVRLYGYDEFIDEENRRHLSEAINENHENVKYLPKIKLPEDIHMITSLEEVVSEADIIFFVLPHQFLQPTLRQMQQCLLSPSSNKNILKAEAMVSLIKGVSFQPSLQVPKSDGGATSPLKQSIQRYTSVIANELRFPEDRMALIMGANIALDVAKDDFVESTIACESPVVCDALQELLDCSTFRTQKTTQVSTVELCGAIKNVYALGAGIIGSHMT